ncbi:MAG: hypothetical protein ACE5H0_13135, partial [Bacteroidota bacterium]
MHSNLFLGLFIAAIIALVAIAVYLFWKGSPNALWIPVAVSFLALVVSLLSAFKAELLPADVDLIGGDVLLAQTTPLSQQPVIPIAFSLGFINRGYGDDIIEWIAVKTTNERNRVVKLLTPIVEIDFQKLLQGRRRLHAENVIGPFAPFHLAAKTSITKTIVFDQEPNQIRYPKTN